MDIIDRKMRSMPGEIRFALITLLQGSSEDIELILPDQMLELKRIAIRSRNSADETIEQFEVVKEVFEELIEGGTVTEKKSIDQVKALEKRILDASIRKEAFEKQKKELLEQKEGVKKHLEKAEKKFEESLDNLPGGWELLGMRVADSLTNAVINIIEVIPSVLKSVSNQSFFNFFDINVCNDQGNNNQKPEPVVSLEFPSCQLLPATGSRVTITEEVKVGLDFADAVQNMFITIQHLEAYIDEIFDRPTEDKLSLVADAAQITNTIKTLLKPSKDQIESTAANSVPIGMKGTAVTFYRKMFALFEQVITTSKNRDSQPEDYKALEKEAMELSESGQCFSSWLNRLMDLPAITPKLPFQANQAEGKGITERHYERAKYTLEQWKWQMEEKREALQEASTRLLIVSHNITVQIIDLEEFNSSKGSVQKKKCGIFHISVFYPPTPSKCGKFILFFFTIFLDGLAHFKYIRKKIFFPLKS